MRGRSKRHPVLETAVFAAALLLSAFVARELWSRRSSAPVPQSPSAMVPVALTPEKPPQQYGISAGRTEQAVTGVPPLKLSRVERRRSRKTVVPAPK